MKIMTRDTLFRYFCILLGGLILLDPLGFTIDIDASQHPNIDPSSLKKIAELRKQAEASPHHVIEFTTAGYKEMVLKAPRAYHVIMLYTVESGCEMCKKMGEILQLTSTSYWEASCQDPAPGHLPVFFGSVEVQKNEKIFHLHGLRTAPHILATDGKSFKKVLKNGEMPFKKQDVFRVDPSSTSTPATLLNWINTKTGRTIKQYESPQAKATKAVIMITGLCAVIAIGIALWGLILRVPILIPIGAISIQYMSTCGLFYNLSHGMQLFGYHGKEVERIAKNNRTQYLGEGLMMSGCILGAGLALLAAASAPTSAYLRQKKLADLASLCFGVIFLGLVYLTLDVYMYKTAWYGPSFFPPPDYLHGPLKVDQGNTF